MQVLSNEKIGTRANFFRAGGNSLLAMRLVAVVRRSEWPAMDMASIFAHSTVEELASHIASSSDKQVNTSNIVVLFLNWVHV